MAALPILVTIVAAFTACASDPADTVDEQTFISVIVELREADREIRADSLPEDSAVALFDARRDSILASYGVTPDQLRGFVHRSADDLETLVDAWDTISERLKYAPGDAGSEHPVDDPGLPMPRPPIGPGEAPIGPPSRPDTQRPDTSGS